MCIKKNKKNKGGGGGGVEERKKNHAEATNLKTKFSLLATAEHTE